MSPGYHLHPEFGLLCPSRSLRRKMRLVLALLVVAGLAAWKAGHRSDTGGALVVAQDDEAQFNAEAVPAVGDTAATTTADGRRPFEGSKTACTGDVWSYIDGTCSLGRARKSARPRAVNDAPTIATLPVGRSTLLPPMSATASLIATDADAAVPTPTVADRTGAPAPPPAPKKAQKPSYRNTGSDVARDRRWREEQWSARAYAYPDDRYLRGRYERWSGSDQVRW